jgi:hypothetical protein
MKNLLKIFHFIVNLISAFGLLWLIVEITAFFANEETINIIKGLWWLFGLLGLGFAIFKLFPRPEYHYKVPDRDATVYIKKKDIFKIPGSIIVTVNHCFKVNQDGDLLKSNSVLSQVVKKFYNNKPEHLQSDINKELEKVFYNDYKELDHYKIGTVVPITQSDRKFYFLANTKLNNQNKSYCDDEIFERSLNELWVYLSDCAGKEDFLIPLICTGNGRLTTDREIVFKEILLSFLSSLSSKNYADSLTICFRPSDIKKHSLNFERIGQFSKAKIEYQDYRERNLKGTNKM